MAPSGSADDGLYRMYVIDENGVDAYAALPLTLDEAASILTPSSNPPGRRDDSTGNGGRDSGGPPPPPGGGGRGGDDTLNRGGNHGGLSRGLDFMRVLRQLDLTRDQWLAVRGCFNDYKECVRTAMERYRAAVQGEREELRSEIVRLKTAIENGDLEPEEARAIYRQLLEGHRAAMRDLKEALRTALEDCRAALMDCIESNLTDEQLVKWERLMGGGRPGNG